MLNTIFRKTFRSNLLKIFNAGGYISYKHQSTKAPMTLMNHLQQRIKATGPITVASFMKEALTNPIWGYYMKKDVIGAKGDFTTSPEISQMFGELIGIWFVLQWSQMGKPTPFQFVELGPGRGTLMADIVRVFNQIGSGEVPFHIHFVEVSEKMKALQMRSLGVKETQNGVNTTSNGANVNWYSRIEDVPQGLSFYVAHEFLDALPVHLFKKMDGEWREVLVNVSSSEDRLELVSAPGPSPLTSLLMNTSAGTDKSEVSPESGVIMSAISQNIAEHGGCGLIVDYGEVTSDRHSLRGFKNHQLIENVFENPGDCDLTANVDFTFLKNSADPRVGCFGPMTQHSFLLQMGIRERLQVLLKTANETQSKQLRSAYEYLVSPEKMGEKFKVLAITSSKTTPPTPFT